MVKEVIIMQGLPGSGKSTLALKEANRRIDADMGLTAVVSADNFFMEEGVYRFNPAKLGEAHASCMRAFISHLTLGDVSTIIVDNTNLTTEQMNPYYLVARAFKAEVEIFQVVCDVLTAYHRNVHGVPLETIERMWLRRQGPPAYWNCVLHVF